MNHSSDSAQVGDEMTGEVWESGVSWTYGGEWLRMEARGEILHIGVQDYETIFPLLDSYTLMWQERYVLV